MTEAISKAKRCEFCPDDAETCYCYDDKPSVYLTESQLDGIVKEFVKPAEGENDRKLKMTVLSLVSDLRNCRAEYAEERAAHNAHVTELSQLEEEMRKLREERDAYYNNARYTEAAFHEVTSLRSQLQSAQQEIERLRQLYEREREIADRALEQVKNLREERNQDRQWIEKASENVTQLQQERYKLIECLRFYERLARGREVNDGGRRARTILAEIGVTVE